MNRHTEFIYLNEIMFQVECADRSIIALNSSLSQSSNDASKIHDHINDLLNHLAVISKILHPSAGKNSGDPRRIRGRHLRVILDIGDNHPILNRDLRDLLEHIDEQLDAWSSTANRGIFFDRFIGSSSAIKVEGLEPHHYTMRSYNPLTTGYVVRSRQFNLKELVEGLHDIANKVQLRLNEIRSQRHKD